MPLPTETMEERFLNEFTTLECTDDTCYAMENLLRDEITTKELLAFIQSELSISQNRILEELLDKMPEEWDMRGAQGVESASHINGYNQALKEVKDIIKLISKKDN